MRLNKKERKITSFRDNLKKIVEETKKQKNLKNVQISIWEDKKELICYAFSNLEQYLIDYDVNYTRLNGNLELEINCNKLTFGYLKDSNSIFIFCDDFEEYYDMCRLDVDSY